MLHSICITGSVRTAEARKALMGYWATLPRREETEEGNFFGYLPARETLSLTIKKPLWTPESIVTPYQGPPVEFALEMLEQVQDQATSFVLGLWESIPSKHFLNRLDPTWVPDDFPSIIDMGSYWLPLKWEPGRLYLDVPELSMHIRNPFGLKLPLDEDDSTADATMLEVG